MFFMYFENLEILSIYHYKFINKTVSEKYLVDKFVTCWNVLVNSWSWKLNVITKNIFLHVVTGFAGAHEPGPCMYF